MQIAKFESWVPGCHEGRGEWGEGEWGEGGGKREQAA